MKTETTTTTTAEAAIVDALGFRAPHRQIEQLIKHLRKFAVGLEQAQAVIRDRDEKINRHGAIQLEKDAELEQAQARITQLEDRLKPQPTLSWPANCRGI